ncbi:translocation protein SEC62 [Nematocida displodere]|uniref:Translocation protein SEC62 n=1 Tax=Nematocida displodere TaxID=1805483 RepID=A0A177EKB3_9MICR|nr:translocation protein SEC62 [Nematocida displodere]
MAEKRAVVRTFTLKEAEKLLRDLPTKDSTLNGIKRVDVFKGSDALIHLMNSKKLLSEEARNVMNTLLEQHYLVRAKSEGEQHTIDVSYDFAVKSEYIWIVEGSQLFTILISALVLAGSLLLAMFPIWPRFMRMGTGYLFYVGLFLFALLIGISIVRVCVNLAIRVAVGRSFWIFPNLFEECGILESFVPFSAWEDEAKEEEAADRASVDAATPVGSGTNEE